MKYILTSIFVINILVLSCLFLLNARTNEEISIGFPLRVELTNKNSWSGKKSYRYLECEIVIKEPCGITLKRCNVGKDYYCQTNIRVYPKVDRGM